MLLDEESHGLHGFTVESSKVLTESPSDFWNTGFYERCSDEVQQLLHACLAELLAVSLAQVIDHSSGDPAQLVDHLSNCLSLFGVLEAFLPPYRSVIEVLEGVGIVIPDGYPISGFLCQLSAAFSHLDRFTIVGNTGLVGNPGFATNGSRS